MGQAIGKRSSVAGRRSSGSSPAGRLSLFQLKYASVLTVGGDQVEQTIAEILAVALKKNPARGITGMLYYNPSKASVVQVLEGPQDTVLSLYDIIKKDPRHSECRLLFADFVDARIYANFGMALTRTSDDTESLIAEAAATGFSEHLVRLMYMSRLCADGVEEARAMIADILRTAVRNNTAREIGGLLCFNPATMQVGQLLEGPAAAVQDLFTTIMADSRHTDCTLTSQELLLSKDEYIFGASWGMMQTETASADGLLNLGAHVKRAFHSRTAAAAMEGQGEAEGLSEAEVQKLIDGAVGGIHTTPTMKVVM